MNVEERNDRWEFIYSQEELERARRYGDVAEGVVFTYDLNPKGADFILFKEPHLSDADIERAKARLRNDRDVTGFSIAYPEEAKASKPEEGAE